MFNIGYFKGQPTDYIIRYSSGEVRNEGKGLAFFYLKHNTQIVAVPTGGIDANFVFNEITSNFQEVTIQGQLTYRIQNPKGAAGLLNFTIDPVRRGYVSNDPEKLAGRMIDPKDGPICRSISERLAMGAFALADVIGAR